MYIRWDPREDKKKNEQAMKKNKNFGKKPFNKPRNNSYFNKAFTSYLKKTEKQRSDNIQRHKITKQYNSNKNNNIIKNTRFAPYKVKKFNPKYNKNPYNKYNTYNKRPYKGYNKYNRKQYNRKPFNRYNKKVFNKGSKKIKRYYRKHWRSLFNYKKHNIRKLTVGKSKRIYIARYYKGEKFFVYKSFGAYAYLLAGRHLKGYLRKEKKFLLNKKHKKGSPYKRKVKRIQKISRRVRKVKSRIIKTIFIPTKKLLGIRKKGKLNLPKYVKTTQWRNYGRRKMFLKNKLTLLYVAEKRKLKLLKRYNKKNRKKILRKIRYLYSSVENKSKYILKAILEKQKNLKDIKLPKITQRKVVWYYIKKDRMGRKHRVSVKIETTSKKKQTVRKTKKQVKRALIIKNNKILINGRYIPLKKRIFITRIKNYKKKSGLLKKNTGRILKAKYKLTLVQGQKCKLNELVWDDVSSQKYNDPLLSQYFYRKSTHRLWRYTNKRNKKTLRVVKNIKHKVESYFYTRLTDTNSKLLNILTEKYNAILKNQNKVELSDDFHLFTDDEEQKKNILSEITKVITSFYKPINNFTVEEEDDLNLEFLTKIALKLNPELTAALMQRCKKPRKLVHVYKKHVEQKTINTILTEVGIAKKRVKTTSKRIVKKQSRKLRKNSKKAFKRFFLFIRMKNRRYKLRAKIGAKRIKKIRNKFISTVLTPLILTPFVMSCKMEIGEKIKQNNQNHKIKNYFMGIRNNFSVYSFTIIVFGLRMTLLNMISRMLVKVRTIINYAGNPYISKNSYKPLEQFARKEFLITWKKWTGGILTNFKRISKRIISRIKNPKHNTIKRHFHIHYPRNIPKFPGFMVATSNNHWPLNESKKVRIKSTQLVEISHLGYFGDITLPLNTTYYSLRSLTSLFMETASYVKTLRKSRHRVKFL